LTKIFGPEPRAALRRLAEGAGRQDLLATGHVVGVHDVTLRVEPGEFLVIMGLSGSGKSTLLRCINRLIEPTAGEVLLDGEAITAASPTRLRHLRRRLGMVFQRFALLPQPDRPGKCRLRPGDSGRGGGGAAPPGSGGPGAGGA